MQTWDFCSRTIQRLKLSFSHNKRTAANMFRKWLFYLKQYLKRYWLFLLSYTWSSTSFCLLPNNLIGVFWSSKHRYSSHSTLNLECITCTFFSFKSVWVQLVKACVYVQKLSSFNKDNTTKFLNNKLFYREHKSLVLFWR